MDVAMLPTVWLIGIFGVIGGSATGDFACGVMALVTVIGPISVATVVALKTKLKYLNAQECAERYGFSARHWYRLVDAARAPKPTRFGRLVRWSVETLEAWESAGCPSCREGRRR